MGSTVEALADRWAAVQRVAFDRLDAALAILDSR
jgi:hypothetical protein